jgi:hypothetical protein
MVIYWWRYRRAVQRGEVDTDAATGHAANETMSQVSDQGVPPGNHPCANIEGVTAKDKGRSFTLFIYALLVAYVAVLIRCIYR